MNFSGISLIRKDAVEADDNLQWSHLDNLPDEGRDDEPRGDFAEITPRDMHIFSAGNWSHNDTNAEPPVGYTASGYICEAALEGENNDEGEYRSNQDGYDAFLHGDFDLASLAMAVEDLLTVSCPGISFSSEAIFSVLYEPECSWDAEVAANSIRIALKQASECKPCRHLLGGGCYRKGCFFNHDLEHITCKYWLLERGCSSLSVSDGGTCPFQHRVFVGHPQQYASAVSASTGYDSSHSAGVNIASLSVNDTIEEFPSLPSSSSSKWNMNQKSSLSSGSRSHIGGEYASALKQQTSGTAGDGTGSGSDINTVFSGPVASWSAHHDPKAWPAATSNTTKLMTTTGAPAGRGDRLKVDSTTTSTGTTRSSGKLKLLPSEWVDSGQSVARGDYAALREEARTLAIARNALLEQATQAYLAGARDIAKNLSAEGQAINRRMKQCHVEAAQQIFTNRNNTQTILGSGSGSSSSGGRIDLHGLHVAEAIECLTALLPAVASAGQSKVTIVTGSGHHTKGPQPGRARLLPAVQSLLSEMRLTYREVKDDNGYVGGLSVSLV